MAEPCLDLAAHAPGSPGRLPGLQFDFMAPRNCGDARSLGAARQRADSGLREPRDGIRGQVASMLAAPGIPLRS